MTLLVLAIIPITLLVMGVPIFIVLMTASCYSCREPLKLFMRGASLCRLALAFVRLHQQM